MLLRHLSIKILNPKKTICNTKLFVVSKLFGFRHIRNAQGHAKTPHGRILIISMIE